jgi:hypothetical protein
LSIPKRYARNLRDYAFGCQEDLNGPDPGIGRHAYPALEYYLVNKTLVPARVMSLPREADARRRTLTEVMFKANPVAMLSPELLSNVQALESNSGQDHCQRAPSLDMNKCCSAHRLAIPTGGRVLQREALCHRVRCVCVRLCMRVRSCVRMLYPRRSRHMH